MIVFIFQWLQSWDLKLKGKIYRWYQSACLILAQVAYYVTLFDLRYSIWQCRTNMSHSELIFCLKSPVKGVRFKLLHLIWIFNYHNLSKSDRRASEGKYLECYVATNLVLNHLSLLCASSQGLIHSFIPNHGLDKLPQLPSVQSCAVIHQCDIQWAGWRRKDMIRIFAHLPVTSWIR